MTLPAEHTPTSFGCFVFRLICDRHIHFICPGAKAVLPCSSHVYFLSQKRSPNAPEGTPRQSQIFSE